MEIWKFALAGITGDLAKKKILPALAQLAEKYQDTVQVNLIGISRSVADSAEINKILNQASQDNFHKINSIKYIQTEYNNPNLISDLLDQNIENQRLILYLAIPPVAYHPILENVAPIKNQLVNVIIEKPFGQNLSEAEEIINLITKYELQDQVHFFDHYLYKTATILTKADKSNLLFLKDRKPSFIKISLLEEEGVKNRGGYYNSIGALKDMWPHIHNLSKLIFDNIPIYPASFNNKIQYIWNKIILGQYNSYLADLEITNSDTDTFFNLVGSVVLNKNKIPLSVISGKKLGRKETQIIVEYGPVENLVWSIFPNPSLTFNGIEHNFSLNLEKNNNLDHTNLFLDLLENNYSKFIPLDDVKCFWISYQEILNVWTKQKSPLEKYNQQNWELL
jgi:glucose-6-phosphate 1-dehydrogenase